MRRDHGAARAALERTANIRAERTNVVYLHGEDPLEKWKREVAEQDDRFERERRERTVASIEQRLSTELTGMMSEMLVQQKDFLMEVIGQVLGEMLSEVRAEFDAKLTELRSALDSEILDLRALINDLRARIDNLDATTAASPHCRDVLN
jgi:hypothetical protein